VLDSLFTFLQINGDGNMEGGCSDEGEREGQDFTSCVVKTPSRNLADRLHLQGRPSPPYASVCQLISAHRFILLINEQQVNVLR
jgi:hypothetical protein